MYCQKLVKFEICEDDHEGNVADNDHKPVVAVRPDLAALLELDKLQYQLYSNLTNFSTSSCRRISIKSD